MLIILLIQKNLGTGQQVIPDCIWDSLLLLKVGPGAHGC
jgi:hypothetical protein